MKNKLLILICISLFCMGCSNENQAARKSKPDNTYYLKGTVFIQVLYKYLEKKYDIQCYSYGINVKTRTGYKDELLHDFDIGFYSRLKLNENEARKMIMEVVQEALNECNSTEYIKSYLYEYPFGFKNISLDIVYVDDSHKRHEDSFISSCYFDYGNITYFIDHKGKVSDQIHETYEEALEKLKAIAN